MSAKKNKGLNALPQFIWGKAFKESKEFLTHTRYPRFICEVLNSSSDQQDNLNIHSLFIDDVGGLSYCGDQYVLLTGFVLLDSGSPPPNETLSTVCSLATFNYVHKKP